MTDIPELALSVRQPWAWAIIHAGKDIENRSWQAVNRGLRIRGRVAIHAAKGMTRDEYEDTRDFLSDRGFCCPEAKNLLRGGIIGSVEVVDVVSESASPWFFGPRGLVLRDPVPCEFVPAVGQLGYFKWERGNVEVTPATWMLRAPVDDEDHSDRTPESFKDILRSELRKRGVDGPGLASITVKNNRATMHWLAAGKQCRLSLDRHYDRYRAGGDVLPALSEEIDKAFVQ